MAKNKDMAKRAEEIKATMKAKERERAKELERRARAAEELARSGGKFADYDPLRSPSDGDMGTEGHGDMGTYTRGDKAPRRRGDKAPRLRRKDTDKRVGIYVEQTDIKTLKIMAVEQGVTLSELCRRIVKAELNRRNRKC